MNIKDMNISARAKSCLLNAGYKDIEDIKDITESDLSQIHNVSDKVKVEILQAVEDYFINIESDVTIIDESVDDEQRCFEFPSSQYELLQTPIHRIFKQRRSWGFFAKEHINVLREFCAYSKEELQDSKHGIVGYDVDDVVNILNDLSLELRPNRYDKCVYIYPLSVKKYYFEKPDSWEYRLYNEAMISYYEWLQDYRNKEVILWETDKDMADNCIISIDELKEYVTEELEEIMDLVSDFSEAMNKTQEGFGEQGVDGDAEIILEAVKDALK